MGTWGTGILENDFSCDVYDDYMELYGDGISPEEINNQIFEEYNDRIKNEDNAHDFWFALAQAQWNKNVLTTEVFEKVKAIVDSGSDIRLWKELDAGEEDIAEREKVLKAFLTQLKNVPPKPEVVGEIKKPDFDKGTCWCKKLNNGNYGAAIILEIDRADKDHFALILTTNINQKDRPTIEEVKNAGVFMYRLESADKPNLAIVWISIDTYLAYELNFEVLGHIDVKQNYSIDSTEYKFGFTKNWNFVFSNLEAQRDHGLRLGKVSKTPVSNYILNEGKKWWQFFKW